MDSLDSRITCIEPILRRLKATKSVIGRMTADAKRSGEISALAAKCVMLGERCGRLEAAVVSTVKPASGAGLVVLDEFVSSSFRET